MAVLDPLKVVVTNWDEGDLALTVPWHPKCSELGERTLYFGRDLYIDRSDFELEPPDDFFRLSPGGSVRLKYGFIVDFEDAVFDADGRLQEVHVRFDPATRSGQDQSGRKVKGTIQWVHQPTAKRLEVRLYDRLFTVPDPGNYDDLASCLNLDSLIVKEALGEPELAESMPEAYFQFERVGFFKQDSGDPWSRPVYNRSVALKDTWAKRK